MSNDTNKNHDMLFVKPNEASQDWLERLFALSMEGRIDEAEKMLEQANHLYTEEFDMYSAISQLTLADAVGREKERRLDMIKKCPSVKTVQVKDNAIRIETNGGMINFMKLSDSYPELRTDPDIQTLRRGGKCGQKAIEISRKIGIPNNVVMGFVYTISDKAKSSHAWVEFEQDGAEFVIDYTMNVVMNKQGYYRLRHAEEISRVSDEDIRRDYPRVSQLALREDEYLMFRDEIMRELDKNASAFER